VLAVPPSHRLAGRERVRVAELAGEPLCLLGRGFCTRRIIEDCFDRAGTQATVVVEMNSVEGLMAVVEAGGPATILPELGTGGRSVKAVRIERPTPKRTVNLLKFRGHAPLRARTVFTQLVRDALDRPK
jgi:LysR family transcriptional regulator, cyn operon transcriptional activator